MFGSRLSEEERRAEAGEARGPRIEEVNSDMEVTEDGRYVDSVGFFVGVGKKRNRKGGQSLATGSGGAGGIDLDELVEALKKLPEHERETCIKRVEISYAANVSCAGSNCSEFGERGDSSPRFVQPTQEDAAKTPCG